MMIKASQRATISQFFQVGIFGLAMSFGYRQALNPLLGTGAVLGFEDKSTIIGENFKSFWNVFTTGYFDRTNRTYIKGLSDC